MKIWEIKVQQLSYVMKSHFAWYLDNKTCCGLITAQHIIKGHGEWKDISLFEVFKWLGLTDQQAKYHSNKVMKFEMP